MTLEPLLSPEEIAELVGCSYHAVLKAIRAGELRAARIGKGYRVQREWLGEWIESGVAPTPEPAPAAEPTPAPVVAAAPARRRPDPWLYAIQCGGDGGPVKIGTAIYPTRRLAEMQIGNPYELRIIAAWRSDLSWETALHEEFAAVRIRGEWFQPTPALLERVLALGGDYGEWAA